jgi:hypothetical protein
MSACAGSSTEGWGTPGVSCDGLRRRGNQPPLTRFHKFASSVCPELSGAQETKVYVLAGQVRMDLEPGRIGFMNTQRRENRWQRSGCTESAIASGPGFPTPIVLHRRALATVGTAPPNILARLATNSLQSDQSYLNLVKSAWFVPQDIRRSLLPPEAGTRAATGKITTHRSFLPFIPSPSALRVSIPPCRSSQ